MENLLGQLQLNYGRKNMFPLDHNGHPLVKNLVLGQTKVWLWRNRDFPTDKDDCTLHQIFGFMIKWDASNILNTVIFREQVLRPPGLIKIFERLFLQGQKEPVFPC